jgi:hypothetical protein
MRIIKFNESLSKQEIDDLLLDLKDSGYEMDSDVFQGFITITGRIFETDRIQFMKDVIELNNRMTSIGYESINDKLHVYMGILDGKHYCQFMLKFRDNEAPSNKDVKSFEEFKEYVEKVLGLQFYEWDTESMIPSIENSSEYRNLRTILKLDINKEQQGSIPAGFTITFEKGSLDDFISTHKKELSAIVMSQDEWAVVNLWSIPDSEKSKYQDSNLVESAKSKQFKFDQKGIEAIEKCVTIFKSLRH